jgi:hypothetical protein
MQGQIRAFREVLAEQPVGVLVAAPLPGRARVAEVDRHSGTNREFGVPGHFLTLIPSHTVPQKLRQGCHLLGQQRGDAFGVAVVGDFHEHDEPGGALDQGRDLRLVALADDEISLARIRVPRGR